jgi:hypothetical protein
LGDVFAQQKIFDVGAQQRTFGQRGFAVDRVVQFAPDTELNCTVGTLLSSSPQAHLWDVKLSTSRTQQMQQENLSLISTTLFVVPTQLSTLFFDDKMFLHSFSVRLKNCDRAKFIVRQVNKTFVEGPSSSDLAKILRQILSHESLKDENKPLKIEIEVK